jgi:hypothetical protein
VKLEARPRNRPTCPLCKDDLEGKLRRCTDCASEAHKACVDEFGKKCPTVGCGGKLKKLKHSSPGPVTLKIHPGGKHPLKTQLQAGLSRYEQMLQASREAERLEELREFRSERDRQRAQLAARSVYERDRRDREQEARGRQEAGRGRSAPPRFVGGRNRTSGKRAPVTALFAFAVAIVTVVYVIWRFLEALIG